MVIRNGSIVVISGPSGVGKDTVVNLITSQADFLRLPTCTTRLKRQSEIDEVHYHFLREEEFLALKQENRLLDHVIISGYHYGLLLEHVFDVTGNGKNILVV
jgi:guanylate kinase